MLFGQSYVRCLIFATLILGSTAWAQSRTSGSAPQPVADIKSLPAGQITDPVSCSNDAAETYALYLPSAYRSSKLWPILYIFDPEARGEIPVRMYMEIADKFGYILAASNNSRNFRNDEVSRSARAVWDDTHGRLALDPRRIYMMGFSGGARVATALAIRCEACAVAGVISHGAGYPFAPTHKDRFAYFAFIGNQDFNWPEIMELRRQKEDWQVPYHLKVFAGDHQWAPPSIFAEALEWLDLRAMQTGALAPDHALIDQWWAKTQKEADDARERKDTIPEFDAVRSLAIDFRGLKDVSPAEPRLAALKNSLELKQALKKQQDAIDQQRALTQGLSADLAKLGNTSTEEQVSLRTAIADGMADLKYKAAHAKTEDDRLVFLRSFNALWVQGIEAGQAEFENAHHIAEAELYFQLMSAVTPEEAWPHLLLAETAAARGDKKRADKELRDAMRRGLKNPDTLEHDANLQSLHADPEYQQIVAELKTRRDSHPAH
jgi:dienelactone hydrolase